MYQVPGQLEVYNKTVSKQKNKNKTTFKKNNNKLKYLCPGPGLVCSISFCCLCVIFPPLFLLSFLETLDYSKCYYCSNTCLKNTV